MRDVVRKVNVLESEWLDVAYRTLVLPELTKVRISNLRESLIPVTRLYDKDYWRVLRSLHRIFLAKFDHRLWYQDDSTFEDYVREFATVSFPAVSIFDTPFDYECPLEHLVDTEASTSVFQKKLYERFSMAASIIKKQQPDTLILSPAICLTKHPEMYIEYLVHNRNLFDVYAMHCCSDGDEKEIARLTTVLNQTLKILQKPVWVTRWAIPSCMHKIESRTLQTTDWRPLSHVEAASKMKRLFMTIDDITGDKSKWFYTGLGRDSYNPHAKIPYPLWAPCSHYPTQDFDIWTMHDFMGMYDYEDNLKSPILTALKELASE